MALLAGVAATMSGGGTQAQGRWVITDLGTIGGKGIEVVAINNRGQIIGNGYERHSSLWQNGKWSDLGSPPDRDLSRPTATAPAAAVGGQ